MRLPSWPDCASLGLDPRPAGQGPLLLRARWLAPLGGLPIIEDAAVLVGSGRILAVGPASELTPPPGCRTLDLGDAVLAPAFVNAHTHTELCHLSASRPASCAGFADWVGWLVRQDLHAATAGDFDQALAAMRAAGTFGLADIATRRPREVAAAIRRAACFGVQTLEWFGHPPLPPEGLTWPKGLPLAEDPQAGLFFAPAGHSLATTSFELLQRAKAHARAVARPYSIHLAEHQGEVDLLCDASGPFSRMLADRGLLPKDFVAPGRSPVAQAQALGLLDEATLAVHCVHADASDVALLAESRATVCLCPRSNALIGVGKAPVAAYLEAGVPLCLGTDSLASSPDLDLLSEAKSLARDLSKDPESPGDWDALLRLLSANAARVLGLDGLLGRLAPGRPAVFAVLGRPEDLPASPLSFHAADAT